MTIFQGFFHDIFLGDSMFRIFTKNFNMLSDNISSFILESVENCIINECDVSTCVRNNNIVMEILQNMALEKQFFFVIFPCGNISNNRDYIVLILTGKKMSADLN